MQDFSHGLAGGDPYAAGGRYGKASDNRNSGGYGSPLSRGRQRLGSEERERVWWSRYAARPSWSAAGITIEGGDNGKPPATASAGSAASSTYSIGAIGSSAWCRSRSRRRVTLV